MGFRNYGMAVGFVLLAWLLGCFAQGESTVRFLGGLGPRAQQILAFREVPLNWEGRILNIDSLHRVEVVDVLCEVLHINAVAIALHHHNLSKNRAWPSSAHKSLLDKTLEKSQLRALEREQEALRKVLNQIAPDLILFDQAPDLDCIGKLESPLHDSPPPRFPGEISVSFSELINKISYTACDFSEEWVVPQSHSVSCGQASVATALNWIHQGEAYDTVAIDEKYGFALLNALNGESAQYDIQWRDAGDLTSSHWPLISQTVNQRKLPVILAFNGHPAPHDLGYIVTIVKIEGERVTYADPYQGSLKTSSKETLLKAERHPDGNFVFVPQ